MDIFLEFLKYGAIGIAMVLVVLSYRLLSKEQEKEHVREPMLKSIKSFIVLALVLAAFFGITEIITLMIAPEVTNDVVKTKVEKIYKRNFPKKNATDIDDKLRSIEVALDKNLNASNNENCDDLKDRISQLEQEVKNAEFGNYIDLVLQLQDSLTIEKGTFVNLSHDEENKSKYYEMLGQILSFLDLISKEDRNVDALILEKWKAFKKTYAYLGNQKKNRADWIVGSDITYLLKVGH